MYKFVYFSVVVMFPFGIEKLKNAGFQEDPFIELRNALLWHAARKIRFFFCVLLKYIIEGK